MRLENLRFDWGRYTGAAYYTAQGYFDSSKGLGDMLKKRVLGQGTIKAVACKKPAVAFPSCRMLLEQF